MSRIGKAIVKLNSAKFAQKENAYEISGPKGILMVPTFNDFNVTLENNELKVEMLKETPKNKAVWGLLRSLLSNAVKGVEEGFVRRLEMVGVGYRASVSGKDLVLNVGYSHQVIFPIPQGVEAAVEENTKIVLKGIDKTLLGQVAANIKKIRKPEPYKGKGIKYEGEVVRRKAGKSGKGAA